MITYAIKYILSKLFLLILQIRYWLYNNHFLGSTHFELPIICIGNLNMGGSGKTPMVDYLITLLENEFKLGIISRGYKRKTTGFIKLKTTDQASIVGDEPLLLKLKHPHTEVAVGEQRIYAIPQLINIAPNIQILLMDDGMQHLSVKPQINILMTNYHQPFWDDKLFPLGTLREPIEAKQKADIIVVGNCPTEMSSTEKNQIIQKINPAIEQKVFFSYIKYNNIYSLFYNDNKTDVSLILITGIANAKYLYEHLENNHPIVHYEFKDHHHYTEKDFENILEHETSKNWITTEKDAVKFLPFKNWFMKHKINVWIQPIEINFHDDKDENFNQTIKNYLAYYFADKHKNEQT